MFLRVVVKTVPYLKKEFRRIAQEEKKYGKNAKLRYFTYIFLFKLYIYIIKIHSIKTSLLQVFESKFFFFK